MNGNNFGNLDAQNSEHNLAQIQSNELPEPVENQDVTEELPVRAHVTKHYLNMCKVLGRIDLEVAPRIQSHREAIYS